MVSTSSGIQEELIKGVHLLNRKKILELLGDFRINGKKSKFVSSFVKFFQKSGLFESV